MKTTAHRVVGLLLSAVVSAGIPATASMAQDKAAAGTQEKMKAEKKGTATQKVLMDNEKVRALEIQFRPGDENQGVPSASPRVVRALKGGTLMRTYTDGKSQKVEWKTGDLRFIEAENVPYTVKNIGKTEVHLYAVVLK